jgi:peptidoglycan hydrolase-like protein with peptidoglycan-binding domain
VWLLQALLKCRGYNILKDGIWTEELTRAVRIFQGASGLEADGVVGPNTYVALGLDRAIFQKE